MSRTNVIPSELVRGIGQLEPLPITAQRLLALLSGEQVPMSTITDLIEVDQAIMASLLRTASSPRYAGRPVMSVRTALQWTGTAALLEIVMEGYLRRLQVEAPLYDLREGELWLHSAAAQQAVRVLAKERPDLRIPEMAGTAALLHDIGKLIVARYVRIDAQEIVSHARTYRLTFVEAERALIGADHAMIGGAIADAWRFPSELADAIRRHHEPPGGPTSPLLDAVSLGNLVAKTIEQGLGAEGLNFAVDPGIAARLGLDFTTFGRICLETEAWVRELMADHGFMSALATRA